MGRLGTCFERVFWQTFFSWRSQFCVNQSDDDTWYTHNTRTKLYFAILQGIFTHLSNDWAVGADVVNLSDLHPSQIPWYYLKTVWTERRAVFDIIEQICKKTSCVTTGRKSCRGPDKCSCSSDRSNSSVLNAKNVMINFNSTVIALLCIRYNKNIKVKVISGRKGK